MEAMYALHQRSEMDEHAPNTAVRSVCARRDAILDASASSLLAAPAARGSATSPNFPCSQAAHKVISMRQVFVRYARGQASYCIIAVGTKFGNANAA